MIKLDMYLQAYFDDDTYTKSDLLDLIRLQKQLLIEEDLLLSINECADIWQGYSNDLQASWLFFPEKDEEIINYIKSNNYFISFENYLTTKNP